MKKKKPPADKYTPTEILEQVSMGNMDPKEAGLTGPVPIIGETQPDPTKLRVLPQGPPKRAFGDKLELQIGVVPLAMRAAWEAQEAKIIPFDNAAWIEQNKHTFRVQAAMAIGNGVLRLDRTFTDPVLGMCSIMEEAAQNLRTEYTTPQEPGPTGPPANETPKIISP
jgi:hypothetical protein